WNIMQYTPVSKAARVLAEWLDERDRRTGYAAVVSSTNCIVISHILLADDLFNKRQMLRAMAGILVPDLWRTAALSLFESAAGIGPYRDFDSAVSALRKVRADVAEVRKKLDSASRAREMARKELTAGRFRESCAKSDEAAQLLLEAYCLAQRPLTGEFRGFWCHSAFGVEGMNWATVAAELKRNGFTAVLPNMSWGGVAYYRSRILPNAPEVASRGDQLAECLTACRRYGIQVHLWKVNWNLGPAPEDFVAKLRREHRLQTDVRGSEQLWLCPSHPENQQLEIEAMLELVRNYELDGLHFDYIRYPNENHCFCEGCRNRFQKASGCRIAVWPRDVLPGGIHRETWLEWRRANITALVRTVSTQARAIRPGIKISAAVFPNWIKARDTVGQDWRLWCEQAYLDFVCPMNYAGSAIEFENLVRHQKQWVGAAFLYPGVGASAVNPTLPPDKVIEQILATRKYNTGGFVVFNLDALQIRETLPLLGLGITRAR
ncbi:MAG: glycoside hydrolase family 10 protein, partial [Kiritimatiellia bacterium]